MKHFDNLYFSNAARSTEMVKAKVVDAHLDPSDGVVFIAEPAYCVWMLANGRFFDVYEGVHREVKCVNSMEDSFRVELPGNFRVYRVSSGSLDDVTDSWRAAKRRIEPNETP